MSNPHRFTNPLHVWRMGRGLSVPKCAHKVGVTRVAWGRWEQGLDIPNDLNLVKLSRMIGVENTETLLAELMDWQSRHAAEYARVASA